MTAKVLCVEVECIRDNTREVEVAQLVVIKELGDMHLVKLW